MKKDTFCKYITINNIEELPCENSLFFKYITVDNPKIKFIGFEKHPYYILINYTAIDNLNIENLITTDEFKNIFKIYAQEIDCEMDLDENYTLEDILTSKKFQFMLINENFGEINPKLYGIYGSPLLLYYIYLHKDFELALAAKKISDQSLQALPSKNKYLLAIEWNSIEELNLELYMNYIYLQTLVNMNKDLYQNANQPTLEDLFKTINFKYDRQEDSKTNKRRLYKLLKRNITFKEPRIYYNQILKIIENLN